MSAKRKEVLMEESSPKDVLRPFLDGAGLQDRAEKLVMAAKVVATSGYIPTGDRFEVVYSVPTDRWDFVVTIAGVFAAMNVLAGNANAGLLPKTQADPVLATVLRSLDEWHPKGTAAVRDCGAFFARTFDFLGNLPIYQDQPNRRMADALGGWIVWNLVGHPPESEQERGLVRVLGSMACFGFADWWFSDDPQVQGRWPASGLPTSQP
jgi:hypothetical protein